MKNDKLFYCSIVAIMFAISVAITASIVIRNDDKIESVNEFRSIRSEFVLGSNEWRFPQERYYCVERESFMVELLPQGETDTDGFVVSKDDRLIKATWYNDERTKVEHVEYYLVSNFDQ
jgi:hypothetical protein